MRQTSNATIKYVPSIKPSTLIILGLDVSLCDHHIMLRETIQVSLNTTYLPKIINEMGLLHMSNLHSESIYERYIHNRKINGTH